MLRAIADEFNYTSSSSLIDEFAICHCWERKNATRELFLRCACRCRPRAVVGRTVTSVNGRGCAPQRSVRLSIRRAASFSICACYHGRLWGRASLVELRIGRDGCSHSKMRRVMPIDNFIGTNRAQSLPSIGNSRCIHNSGHFPLIFRSKFACLQTI